jgi:signal transduction histidine kinase/CheY-like chemotaxis protein
MTLFRVLRHHWRRVVLLLLCPGMVLASLWMAHQLTIDTQSWPGIRLSQAQASPDAVADSDSPPGPQAPWQPVTLPDNWKVTRPNATGSVWYRIPVEPLGIRQAAVLIPRLAASGQVFLNGSQLWDGRSSSPTVTHSWNAPLLLALPAGLLRPSGNELLIQVSGPSRLRSGLSTIQLGSLAELQPYYKHRQVWQHDGAMLSCAVSAIAGLLLLLMWARRQSESMFLYFGLATVLWALRNSNLFLTELPVPVDTWAILVHAGHIWFNTLFAMFVLRFTQARWPRLEKAIWFYAIVNSVLMWGGALRTIETVLSWMILPSLALYFFLVALLVKKGWQERKLEPTLIAATTLTFVALSLRDAMLLGSKLPYDAYYLSHYTGVLMLVAIAWTLVSRLEDALRTNELLNSDLERRVARRTHELEVANASKTRFLAAASHDMRQPVASIGLLLDVLREQIATAPLRAMVDRIREAAMSLEELLKGLMDLSRLESGATRPRIQPIALAPLFDAIDLHYRLAAVAKGIELRFRPTSLAVNSDPMLLDQVLRNLVDNAIRYTDTGGVLVGARRWRDKVLLQVWDTGHGIAAAEQDLVFEEFVQLENPSRGRHKGLGLGLAIVQRSLQLLGQRIVLMSRVGRGSCFSVELPFAGHAAASPRSQSPTDVVSTPLRGVNIWVIEDDPSVRQALVARLENWGAEVRSMCTQGDVLRQLDAAPGDMPALVISDQRLPDGTGIACVALVRDRAGRQVPALIVTGDTAPHDMAAMDASGLPVLYKPFSGNDFLLAIQSTLS